MNRNAPKAGHRWVRAAVPLMIVGLAVLSWARPATADGTFVSYNLYGSASLGQTGCNYDSAGNYLYMATQATAQDGTFECNAMVAPSTSNSYGEVYTQCSLLNGQPPVNTKVTIYYFDSNRVPKAVKSSASVAWGDTASTSLSPVYNSSGVSCGPGVSFVAMSFGWTITGQ